MKISIITVCLNSAETIEDTIKSILSQDYKDIEYIVVDGGSTDGTLEIIEKYNGQIHKCISEPDKGIYDAMNKGIKLSTGEIIATLNSDDVYADENVVSKMEEFIQANDLDAAYAGLVYVSRKNPSRVVRVWMPGQYRRGAFSNGWVVPHPTFFCRKKIYEQFGCFNDKLHTAADFELLLRFIEAHRIKVGYLPKVIVKMRTGGKANVLRGMIRGNGEIIKSFRLNGLRLSPWFFIRKPIVKISQLFVKLDRLSNTNFVQ
jgi:glycosyltransferase involved in cell wall biosynthesis